MAPTVCLYARTLDYPEHGGHHWVYLNWALGFQACGYAVLWMEGVQPDEPVERLSRNLDLLRRRLEPYGLAERVVLCGHTPAPIPTPVAESCRSLEEAADEAELFLNMGYAIRPEVVGAFRTSVLLDIDPGLLQAWMAEGKMPLPRHDHYCTTGETVGTPQARFPDVGLDWIYTPPCVATDAWPVRTAPEGSRYTTVSHWQMGEYMVEDGEVYSNDKRTGFLPYLDLPRKTGAPLELALCLAENEEEEKRDLVEKGWSVRDSLRVAGTPDAYRDFIQKSRGEFSCVKPSCVRFQNAWVSDRTLCYLSSGKPAVVQHTGPSRILPERAGMFRFRTFDEAVECLSEVEADYENQCRLARRLAEEHFDARRVVGELLGRVAGG